MTIRDMPAAASSTKPGIRSEICPQALERWNPDVRQAVEEEKENTISVLDVIGQDWYGEGVTSKRIAGALRAIGKKDVTVVINSPGGDYFEGLAIYNMLREHPAKVTVKIVGIAASAASVIAMAGDEIQIARAGFLMIHNTWVVAIGDRHALRDVADWLEPFDTAAVDIYAARTGMKEADLGKMLDREAWVGGADAVSKGFADSLLASDEVETKAKNSSEGRPMVAARRVEQLLAKAGVSRKERAELVMALKGGPRDAAATGLREAAVVAEVSNLLNEIKSLRSS